MSSAAACVRPHLRVLRACGYCRPRAAPPAHALYRALVLALTALYLAQECVYAYQERRDLDKLARVMFLLLCHVTSVVKQLVFLRDAARVDRIVGALGHALHGGGGAAGAAQRARAARGAARFVRAYAGAAVCTCTLWAVYPLLQRARRQRVEFPLWLPFDPHPWPRFAAVLLYSYLVTTLVGVANTTMDAFVATVLNQYKTQLTILRMNFGTVTSRAAAAAGAGAGAAYERALRRLFLDCLEHYRIICDDVRAVQRTFGAAILIQFGIGGWILCMAAYKMVGLRVLSVEFASMAMFISCILTELFLYCYYGNEVSVESARVAGAAYGVRWEGAARSLRRELLLVMQRAQRPLAPRAGRVVPLSLETFLKIIKSSYTFYAVLRQMKEA